MVRFITRLIYLFIILICSLLYRSLLYHDYLYFDDNRLIIDQVSFFQSADMIDFFTTDTFSSSAVTKVFYRPLFSISLYLNYLLSGTNASAFYLTNLILHLLNLTLIYIISLRVYSTWQWSALALVVFAFHPALVQTIAWIPGRNDLLLTTFFLLSSYFYKNSPRRFLNYSLHGLFFTAALFTKESALLLPLLWLAWEPQTFYQAKSKYIQTWIISPLIYLWFRSTVISSSAIPPIAHNYLLILKTSLQVISINLAYALLPLKIPPIPHVADLPGAIIPIGLLILLILIKVTAKSIRLALFSAFLLLSFSLPVIFSPLIGTSSNLMLHRIYLPLACLVLFLPNRSTLFNKFTPSLFLTSLIMWSYVYLSSLRLTQFTDALTFWTASAHASPHSSLVWTNYGSILLAHQRYSQAKVVLNQALSLNPQGKYLHANLALLAEAQGNLSSAVLEMETETRLFPTAPSFWYLGNLYLLYNESDMAIKSFSSALKLDPNFRDRIILPEKIPAFTATLSN